MSRYELPNAIKILGSLYMIIEKECISHGGSQIGEIDYLSQFIIIKRDIAPEKKRITLLHEVLHGIFEQLGFIEECTNERLICALSTALVHFLNENPEAVSYLIKPTDEIK